MIASIMMQESSCNKDTVGGGGEQGLMQITKDKCGGAPGGNCKDPVSASVSCLVILDTYTTRFGQTYNINTGAAYLASQIKASGDNVLLAVGSYVRQLRIFLHN